MAAIAAIVGLLGTGLQVAGQLQQGQSAKAQAEYNAKVQEKQGSEEFASAQREGLKAKREGDIAMSNATALAAASGAGGAETPSVANTIGDIYAMSDYNQRSALFRGTEAKAGRYDQAALSRAKGKSAMQGSELEAFGTGAGGLYKYGQSFYG